MQTRRSDSLGFIFSQVIRLHHARVHGLFGGAGLHRGQPPVLFMLWEQDGLPQKDIAHRLRLKPATVTDTLQRMERAGLLVRNPDSEDMRISRVFLTEKGRELRPEVERLLKTIEEECFAGFTPEEKALIRRFFMQMRDNLTRVTGEEIEL